jgi:hypothetical protein
MASGAALFIDIYGSNTIQNSDLKTDPNPDGSDFTIDEIVEPHPGLVRVDLNIWGKAVASLNPTFRVYREEPLFGKKFCKGESFNLKDAITDSVNGEYRALVSIEVGNHRLAIVLEDAETGAQLKAVWRRTSKQSV